MSTALVLFNGQGEPNVSTNQIADELDISPGNLHYHFRSKSEIVKTLFARFRTRLRDILQASPPAFIHVEDIWLFLHLLFESIRAYQFLYHDVGSLIRRYPELERDLRRTMVDTRRSLQEYCLGLARRGTLIANEKEVEILAETMTLTTTYWLSWENALGSPLSVPQQLSRGVYHVLSLLIPCLHGDARLLLESLADRYPVHGSDT